MKKYRLNKGFITQKVGSKTTVFSGEDSILYTFNNTASFIFNGLKLGWEKSKIIQGLVEKYGVKRTTAASDIEDFIKQLKTKKILS